MEPRRVTSLNGPAIPRTPRVGNRVKGTSEILDGARNSTVVLIVAEPLYGVHHQCGGVRDQCVDHIGLASSRGRRFHGEG